MVVFTKKMRTESLPSCEKTRCSGLRLLHDQFAPGVAANLYFREYVPMGIDSL